MSEGLGILGKGTGVGREGSRSSSIDSDFSGGKRV